MPGRDDQKRDVAVVSGHVPRSSAPCSEGEGDMVTASMPFGKHRGQRIADLNTNYLRWVLRECVNLDPFLHWQIESELCERGERYLSAAVVLSELEELIAAAIDE